MYETHSHRITDRIVSLYQPHVRPIVCGKVKSPVEFGAKVLIGLVDGFSFVEKIGWERFTSKTATIFTIERSRAGPLVLEFIKDCFDGVSVSDFWYAYNVLTCAKQKCLMHLLRELEWVAKYKDSDGDWPAFSKKLKRLLRDAIRLRKSKDELDEPTYRRRCERMEKRLQLILAHGWSNKEAKRLIKRLTRHQDEVLTFLHHANVPFENNFGERSIRGAVIMRKNSFHNRSEKGASTQSVMMGVFFTIKQRGLNPVDTVKEALKTYIKTGQLSGLKEFIASNG